MGMFDVVVLDCPKCNEQFVIQSKAGECALRQYTAYDSPPAVAASLDGETHQCTKCSAKIAVKATCVLTVYVVSDPQNFVMHVPADNA